MKELEQYIKEEMYKWLLNQGLYKIPEEIIERKRRELYKEFLEKQLKKDMLLGKHRKVKINKIRK